MASAHWRIVLAPCNRQRSRVVYPAHTMALCAKGSAENTTAFGSRYFYASGQWQRLNTAIASPWVTAR